jgi:predicted CxxxxCH...CXXCH cytochrome family protein
VLIAALCCLVLISTTSDAITNPPHDASNGINCDNCHFTFSSLPAWWSASPADIDDDQYNRVCWQAGCHDGGGMPYIKTHSSLAMGSNKYGTWTFKCVSCHNPHLQRQVYNSDYASALTGTVTAVDGGGGVLTLDIALPDRTGDADPVNDYVGWLIVPNTKYRTINYRIASNTVNTVTVVGTLNTARVPVNSTFAMIVGRLLRDAISLRTVKFYRSEGVNSFADGNATYDGVCEVCHTGTENPVSHDARHRRTGNADSHYNAQNCTTCHHHTEGFKPSCNACHGYAPVDAGSLVFNPDPTGSVTAGAHSQHVTGAGITCDYCHYKSSGSGSTHNDGSPEVITMGFYLFGGTYQGGTYNGQSVADGYDVTVTSPATTVTSSGSAGSSTLTCSTIYCHGTLPDGRDLGGGADTTPSWDGSVSCGDCHRATAALPPTRGSHTIHARAYNSGYNYDCGFCHKDPSVDNALHVNAKSEVPFSTHPMTTGGSYSGSDAVLDAYGTCTNVYCHSTAQSSPPGSGPFYRTSPVWGVSSSGCARCHYFSDSTPQLATGSHSKHFFRSDTEQCYACHNWENTDDPCFSCHNASDFWELRKKHVNYVIDVQFSSPRYGGTYSGSSIPGVGYGDCSNVYCHGNYPGSGLNASPTWGSAATGACGTCHGAENVQANVPASGSHERHAADGTQRYIASYDMRNKEYACTLCHKDIAGGTGPSGYTIADTSKHVSGKVDWKFDTSDPRLAIGAPSYSIASGTVSPSDGTGRAYGSCTIYCHSNVQPDGGIGDPDSYEALDDASPRKWGEATGCYGCHTDYTAYQNKADTSQSVERHKRIFSGSHVKHLNNTGVGSNPVDCLACHNWPGTASGTGSGCNWGYCHNTPEEKTLHTDGKIDIFFGVSINGSYNDPDTNVPGDGYNDCSNTYCHSDGRSLRTGEVAPNTSPVWGNSASLPCNACHGNTNPAYSDNDCANGLDRRAGMPDYPNRTSENDYTNKENSHVEHVVDNDIGCEYCHWNTTQDGCTINNQSYHASVSVYRVTSATSNRQYAGRDLDIIWYYTPDTLDVQPDFGGYCRRVSCHGSTTDTSFIVQSYSFLPWGQYQGCDTCHSRYANTGTTGEGDIDNYTYGNGTHAYIDRDQWEWSGHGKASGTYDVSGNPAADFNGAAGCSTPLFDRCDPCLYCHDDFVDHDKTNSGPNFFRLANYNVLGNGWNDTCLVCHKTGTTGYDPDGGGGGMAKKTATVKIPGSNNSHWGPKHVASNDGGSLCWDCHDPHGDRYQSTGNIYMIQEEVTVDKLDAIGKPASTASPVFTANTTGTDYAKSSAPFDGICNVCHTITDFFTSSSGGGHIDSQNDTQKCTNCHETDIHYGLDPDIDSDGDTVKDINDNCPDDPNTSQDNSDSDIWGDACDACPLDPDNDIDGDGICGDVDVCPQDANNDSLDSDGVCACTLVPSSFCVGIVDNCPNDANPGQEDQDGDGIGDQCDPVCYGFPKTEWVENYGTGSGDFGNGIAVDSGGNIYLTGRTYGAWDGTNQGTDDAFIAKYDTDGVNQWARQTGTSSWDSGNSIDVDTAGNVYVTGHATGQLPGSDTLTYPEDTFAGDYDVFITKYNSSGTRQWVRQMGTTGRDNSLSIAVDTGGNSYIAGDTPLTLPGASASAGSTDVFYAKYDTNGVKLWVKQFGSVSSDYRGYISPDPSGAYIYITGTTNGTLPGSPDANTGGADIFVAKFDASTGNNIWVRQLGTSGTEVPTGIAVDGSGSAYITGYGNTLLPGSSDTYSGGLYDAFVAKYDSAGNRIWVKMFGTSLADLSWGITLNSDGSYVFVAGRTDGRTMFRQDNSRFNYDEIFFARYYAADPDDPDHPVLGKLIGTTSDEEASDIAVDASGNSYVTGDAPTQLPGSSTWYGGSDTYIIKSSYCP